MKGKINKIVRGAGYSALVVAVAGASYLAGNFVRNKLEKLEAKPVSYTNILTYQDKNRNELYDTLRTEFPDGKVTETRLGYEVPRDEIEKHAFITPLEIMKFE